MSNLNFLGLGNPRLGRPAGTPTEQVVIQQILHRVLSFVGCSIDDVVNDPICKNKVIGFYKLHRFVERRCESLELEEQWNATGRRL